MIYLLHGPDTVSSRSFLIKFKEKYSSVSVVSVKKGAKDVSFPQASSLLAEEHLLIVENFLPKDKPLVAQEADLLIWTDATVEVPSWIDKVFLFKQDGAVSVFQLADAIFYGQQKLSLQILTKALSADLPEELIIGSLTRSVRQLSLALEGDFEKISSSSFVQKKVKEQAKNWSLKKLRQAAKLLLKADWEIKTGKISPRVSLTSVVNNLSQLRARA